MVAERRVVVHIEDEPEMIRLARLILRKKGVSLIGAKDGLEGLEVVRTVKPDLVLLDLMMPKMDGWDVYRERKAEDELKDIPVIVLTVKKRAEDKSRILNTVQDYLTKPFKVQALLQSVCTVLGVPF